MDEADVDDRETWNQVKLLLFQRDYVGITNLLEQNHNLQKSHFAFLLFEAMRENQLDLFKEDFWSLIRGIYSNFSLNIKLQTKRVEDDIAVCQTRIDMYCNGMNEDEEKEALGTLSGLLK